MICFKLTGSYANGLREFDFNTLSLRDFLYVASKWHLARRH